MSTCLKAANHDNKAETSLSSDDFIHFCNWSFHIYYLFYVVIRYNVLSLPIAYTPTEVGHNETSVSKKSTTDFTNNEDCSTLDFKGNEGSGEQLEGRIPVCNESF